MTAMIPRWGRLRALIARPRRPAVEDGRLRQVLTHFDTTLTARAAPARGGRRSRSLVLDTAGGRKLLKQYKSSLSAADIQYEHEVLTFLAHAGFRAPRLVPSRSGATLVTVADRHYALFDFVDGFRYTDFYWTPRREQGFVVEAGRSLAELHRTTLGFRPEGQKQDGFTPDGERPWHDEHWYVQALQRGGQAIRSRPDPGDFGRFVLARLERLQEGLEVLGARISAQQAALPKLVVHGDYGPYNLLFNQAGLAAVLDFECARFDLRASEALFALYRFAGQRDAVLNLDKVRAFSSAYCARYPLTPIEVELAPELLALSCVRGIARVVIRWAAGERVDVAGVSRLRRLWDWVETAPDRFRALLTA